MISQELFILIITAATIGFFHTIFGPDHYLPFIAMAKAGRWSKSKTFFVTLLSGLGHVFSSVGLGFLGIAFGFTVAKLEAIESLRGDIAGWALITFGLLYFAWGMRRAIRGRIDLPIENQSITPWVILTIFILGPCEPLIPILMYPAATGSLGNVIAVTAVFGLVTVMTMLGVVFIGCFGLNVLPLTKFARYDHAAAGATICLCGLAVKFFGL